MNIFNTFLFAHATNILVLDNFTHVFSLNKFHEYKFRCRNI